MRKIRAFTLLELLISITILSVIGGVSVMALNLVFTTFKKTDDHTAARTEIEFAFNELRPQITNIGLGMPNSTAGNDSFKKGFDGIGGFAATMTAPVQPSPDGDVLFYAWAEQTGVRFGAEKYEIRVATIAGATGGVITPKITLFSDVKAVISSDEKNNPRSWMLFPSLKIPLHVDNLSLVEVSDGFKGTLNGYAEVHLLKIARLYVDKGKLMQEILGGETRTLAHNIVSTKFKFDTTTRVLTMTVTARGNSSGGENEIVERMTWRIKN